MLTDLRAANLPTATVGLLHTRILFLDDSGKPDANHASDAVVIGGFAHRLRSVPDVSPDECLGAKGHFYSQRGQPQAWEIKSTSIVKPNPWKRAKNRNFVAEVARVISAAGGTVFTATIHKANMNHQMTLATTMPLQLQVLVEHFEGRVPGARAARG